MRVAASSLGRSTGGGIVGGGRGTSSATGGSGAPLEPLEPPPATPALPALEKSTHVVPPLVVTFNNPSPSRTSNPHSVRVGAACIPSTPATRATSASVTAWPARR